MKIKSLTRLTKIISKHQTFFFLKRCFSVGELCHSFTVDQKSVKNPIKAIFDAISLSGKSDEQMSQSISTNLIVI